MYQGPEQIRTRKANDLSLQHISITDIKRNVESIKANNAARRKELNQYFLARSQVQPQTSQNFSLQAKQRELKVQNPEMLSRKLPNKSVERRLKTQDYSSVPDKVDKTQLLYFNPKRMLPTHESETQTYNNDKPQRSDSIQQIKQVIKGNRRQLYNNRHLTLYDEHVSAFQSLYEILNNIMISLRKKQRILQEHISEYLDFIGQTSFLDEFILECDPRYHKVLRTSRLLELIAVLYVSVELSKGTLHDNYNNLGNFIGHSAASLVLMAKLYILSQKPQELRASRFQQAIKIFQKTAYYSMLNDPYDIVLRIQHNNQTLAKVQTSLAKNNNVKLQARLRQFAQQYHQQSYPSTLAFVFLFQYLAYYLHANGLNGLTPFLDVAPAPYLPQANTNKPLIVIEPINVLIWSQLDKFYVRPYTGQFLDFISDHAQVVFWTQLMPNQIEGLLDRVDQAHKIEYRLFKYHCVRGGDGVFAKDISRLGRDVENIFVIDSDRRGFGEYTQNGVEMYWAGSRKDRRLLTLCDILAELFTKKPNVSEFCQNMQEQLNEIKTIKMKTRRATPIRRKNLQYRLMNF